MRNDRNSNPLRICGVAAVVRAGQHSTALLHRLISDWLFDDVLITEEGGGIPKEKRNTTN